MADVDHAVVHFTGRVQGVGFRFTTRQIAQEFEVTGFVRNLADGRVLLEVEGAAADIRDFVAAIEERMHGHIRKVERAADRRAAQFRGFEIR